MTTVKHAEINLPIYKKGDDMDSCLVKNEDGSVNVRDSLTKYSDLLKYCSDILIQIRNAIPEQNNLKLHGDTHYIGLNGDSNIIDRLVNLDLVSVDDEMDDENESDNEDIAIDDESEEDDKSDDNNDN